MTRIITFAHRYTRRPKRTPVAGSAIVRKRRTTGAVMARQPRSCPALVHGTVMTTVRTEDWTIQGSAGCLASQA